MAGKGQLLRTEHSKMDSDTTKTVRPEQPTLQSEHPVAGDANSNSETGKLTQPINNSKDSSTTNIDPPSVNNNTGVSDGHQVISNSHNNDDEWSYVVVGGCLIPPSNFGLIEADMYRSGMVNELNLTFLEQLRLRTIVYLSYEEPSDKLADFIDDQGIQLEQFWDDPADLTPWAPMSEHVVLSAMQVLLDVTMHPVLVMCSHGRHRTGTVIGCLRKLQGWSLSAIFEEYDRHADGRIRLANEQFIELFDTDLINVPAENRPRWLR